MDREIIAAIDIETTGLDLHYHDIIEIAIQPLDEAFEPSPDIPPFVARIKARRPQNASAKAMEVNGLDLNDGDEYHEFLARLLAWLDEYRVEKIQMLGQNADFDRAFISAQIPELGRLLGHRYLRDSQRLACAYNDLVRLMTGKPAFENVGLSDLRRALGIEGSREHRALDDARDAARVYKALLEKMDISCETDEDAEEDADEEQIGFFADEGEADLQLNTKWEMEKECNLCHHKITGVLYDALDKHHFPQWATMCADCFHKHGMRLGVGFGQKYEQRADGEFYLVDGNQKVDHTPFDELGF